MRLHRDELLSFYYCSAYGLSTPDGSVSDGDIAGVDARKTSCAQSQG